VLPAQDTTHTVLHELWFDGVKMHMSDRGNHCFDGVRMVYVPQHNISTFDGKVVKTVALIGDEISPFAQGMIRNAARAIDAGVPSARPVLMTFRALSPELRSYDIERMTITGRQDVIGGRPCLQLLYKGGSDYSRHFWVDADRGFVITRYLYTEKGKIHQKIDVRYKPDPVAGWCPEGWDIDTFKRDGPLNRSQRGIVTEGELNGVIPARQFDIDYPYGSIVIDERKRFHYVVQEGGRKRQILHVKSRDVENSAGLWMRVEGLDGKGNYSVSSDLMRTPIKGTTDWKRCEVVLDVPKEGDAAIYFGVMLAGKGQVWADDFKFEAVGEDVRTTGGRAETGKAPGGPPKRLPTYPRNLDFEQRSPEPETKSDP
jgi:hypothetical protein